MQGTVMFVDDEASILDALSRIFEEDDSVEVVTALDAQEALETLAERPVNLVVADEMLPGMDGIALLQAVRSRFPGTEVMMLTGYAEQKVDEIAAALGTDTVIMNKPWDAQSLSRLIHERLSRRA